MKPNLNTGRAPDTPLSPVQEVKMDMPQLLPVTSARNDMCAQNEAASVSQNEAHGESEAGNGGKLTRDQLEKWNQLVASQPPELRKASLRGCYMNMISAAMASTPNVQGAGDSPLSSAFTSPNKSPYSGPSDTSGHSGSNQVKVDPNDITGNSIEVTRIPLGVKVKPDFDADWASNKSWAGSSRSSAYTTPERSAHSSSDSGRAPSHMSSPHSEPTNQNPRIVEILADSPPYGMGQNSSRSSAFTTPEKSPLPKHRTNEDIESPSPSTGTAQPNVVKQVMLYQGQGHQKALTLSQNLQCKLPARFLSQSVHHSDLVSPKPAVPKTDTPIGAKSGQLMLTSSAVAVQKRLSFSDNFQVQLFHENGSEKAESVQDADTRVEGSIPTDLQGDLTENGSANIENQRENPSPPGCGQERKKNNPLLPGYSVMTDMSPLSPAWYPSPGDSPSPPGEHGVSHLPSRFKKCLEPLETSDIDMQISSCDVTPLSANQDSDPNSIDDKMNQSSNDNSGGVCVDDVITEPSNQQSDNSVVPHCDVKMSAVQVANDNQDNNECNTERSVQTLDDTSGDINIEPNSKQNLSVEKTKVDCDRTTEKSEIEKKFITKDNTSVLDNAVTNESHNQNVNNNLNQAQNEVGIQLELSRDSVGKLPANGNREFESKQSDQDDRENDKDGGKRQPIRGQLSRQSPVMQSPGSDLGHGDIEGSPKSSSRRDNTEIEIARMGALETGSPIPSHNISKETVIDQSEQFSESDVRLYYERASPESLNDFLQSETVLHEKGSSPHANQSNSSQNSDSESLIQSQSPSFKDDTQISVIQDTLVDRSVELTPVESNCALKIEEMNNSEGIEEQKACKTKMVDATGQVTQSLLNLVEKTNREDVRRRNKSEAVICDDLPDIEVTRSRLEITRRKSLSKTKDNGSLPVPPSVTASSQVF